MDYSALPCKADFSCLKELNLHKIIPRPFSSAANNLISMFVFFFNFVRPHSALNGLTPAQVAGLNLSKNKD
jgi:transposase InsO family protein